MDHYLEIKKIKELVIKSLFFNDFLYNHLVLKGGTALEILGFNQRASMDVDFSIEGTFETEDLEDIRLSIEKSLKNMFAQEDLDIIDVKLSESPVKMPPKKETYWGGYTLEFKIVDSKYYKLYAAGEMTQDDLRRRSMIANSSNQGKKFKVDISRYEYCDNKQAMDLNGYQIYVYSPLMIVYEKLRAICQQDNEYKKSERVSITPRARDFFDIHSILEHNHDDYLYEKTKEIDNLKMITEIFRLKKVPLTSLDTINANREFHRESFTDVKDTITDQTNVESYDYYFDYVVRLANSISESINS